MLDDVTQIQGVILIHPYSLETPSQAQAKISFVSFPGVTLSSQDENQN